MASFNVVFLQCSVELGHFESSNRNELHGVEEEIRLDSLQVILRDRGVSALHHLVRFAECQGVVLTRFLSEARWDGGMGRMKGGLID